METHPCNTEKKARNLKPILFLLWIEWFLTTTNKLISFTQITILNKHYNLFYKYIYFILKLSEAMTH